MVSFKGHLTKENTEFSQWFSQRKIKEWLMDGLERLKTVGFSLTKSRKLFFCLVKEWFLVNGASSSLHKSERENESDLFAVSGHWK